MVVELAINHAVGVLRSSKQSPRMDYARQVFRLLFVMTVGLLASACTSDPWLPPEFQLRQKIFEAGESHIVGPGGLNHSFVVYQLPNDVSDRIAAGGLAYLNSLPSTAELANKVKPPRVDSYEVVEGHKVTSVTGPWWGPFTNWAATPVDRDPRWLRGRQKVRVGWHPSLMNFFSKFKGHKAEDMVAKVPPDLEAAFNEAISSAGSFYAYGHYSGMCLLVVSPATRRAYFLFRD